MSLEIGVKNIQAAAYNGARTVYIQHMVTYHIFLRDMYLAVKTLKLTLLEMEKATFRNNFRRYFIKIKFLVPSLQIMYEGIGRL